MDGIVRLFARQAADLRAALTPLRERYGAGPDFGPRLNAVMPCRQLLTVIAAIVEGFGPVGPDERLRRAVRPAAELVRPHLPPASGPQRVFACRLEELRLGLGAAPVPFLLAPPTRSTGHLDAAALVARLADLEAAGHQPWPYDLEQALLRLPREPDEEAAARARTLASPAGRRLVPWLRDGGFGDPPTSRVESVRPGWLRLPETSRGPRLRPLVAVEPAPATDLAIARAFCDWRPPQSSTADFGVALWPSLLPSHREVVAAHALPSVADAAHLDLRGGAATLPVLAECAGPTGPATALGLAYGLAARHPQDRTAAVDALLLYAANGDLDGAVVGAGVGEMCATGATKLTRVVSALGDVATGAPGMVWLIAGAALPALLGEDRPPRGTPELLQLAARVAAGAAGVGAGVEVAGLAAVAARGGSSQLVTEARRLHRVLAGGHGP